MKPKTPIGLIVGHYQMGMSTRQVGRELGLDPSTVYERLKGAGVRIRSKLESQQINSGRRPISDEEVRMVKACLDEGLSLKKIRNRMRVGYYRVRAIAHELTRSSRRETQSMWNHIEADYKQGLNLIQLGEKYNKDTGQLYRRLKKAGVEIRGKSEALKASIASGRMRMPYGQGHPSWKGGSKIQRGYRFIWFGPGQYRQEHRLVFEEFWGGRLSIHELIHHMDRNTLNNDINNLLLCHGRNEHMKLHGLEHMAALRFSARSVNGGGK